MTLAEYEKNRAAYIEYLLMCVRLGDWLKMRSLTKKYDWNTVK